MYQQTKTHIHERGWRCVCPDVYCMCVSVCGCVVGAARAALSQICGGLQECWLPLKSPLSALSKYQVQNEGNVASQGPIQLCFIEGSCPCCLCCCGGGWRGHIHTDEVSWTQGWSSKRHPPLVKTHKPGWGSPGRGTHNETVECGRYARLLPVKCRIQDSANLQR